MKIKKLVVREFIEQADLVSKKAQKWILGAYAGGCYCGNTYCCNCNAGNTTWSCLGGSSWDCLDDAPPSCINGTKHCSGPCE